MPSTLVQALRALIWAIVLFLFFYIVWLFYCDCQHSPWRAAIDLPHVAALK
jgi:hypothetical protein